MKRVQDLRQHEEGFGLEDGEAVLGDEDAVLRK